MSLEENSLQPVDIEKIKMAVRLHTPIEITTYTLPRAMEFYIQDVMTEFLKYCHQQHMIDPLKFCLGELLTNSKKANTKRVYFQEKNLDINDEMQYNDGMISFKEDTLGNINHYLQLQKDEELYIKFILKVDDDNVLIQLKNKAILTKAEKRRINEKLKTAQKYSNVQEVLAKVIDQTEGAGLGIIIIILMLEKAGLSRDNFKIYSNDVETVTSILLPVNQEIHRGLNYINYAFVETCAQIPVRKESLEKMTELLSQPEVTKEQILSLVSADVTLAAVLLKRSTEIRKGCCNLSTAIDLIGIENLSSIFNEANPVIKTDFEASSEEWKHAYDTAFYCYNLAKNTYGGTVDAEEAYTLGLFHDFTSVMRAAVNQDKLDEIKEKALAKQFSPEAFDMFMYGGCKNECGQSITDKLGLPEKLGMVIRYHNCPWSAPEEIKKLSNIIYVADSIQYYKSGLIEYYQIEPSVLELMNIHSEADLQKIINEVESVM